MHFAAAGGLNEGGRSSRHGCCWRTQRFTMSDAAVNSLRETTQDDVSRQEELDMRALRNPPSSFFSCRQLQHLGPFAAFVERSSIASAKSSCCTQHRATHATMQPSTPWLHYHQYVLRYHHQAHHPPPRPHTAGSIAALLRVLCLQHRRSTPPRAQLRCRQRRAARVRAGGKVG